MKINKLHLQNFRCHRDSLLELDEINVIIGKNGAGKTSLKDAIEYALTGRNRLTDRRGAGADIMINWEADKAAIQLDLAGIGTITREIPNNLQVADWEGNKTVQEETLLDKLGVDKKTIKAILNTTNFIKLDSEKQRGLIFDLAGLKFDKDKIINAFLKWNQGEIDQSTDILEEIIPEELAGGSELFNQIYQDFYQLRREEKRKLKEVKNKLKHIPEPPPLPEHIQTEDKKKIELQFDELTRERDKLIKELGKLENKLEKKDKLIDEIETLEENIKTAKEEQKENIIKPDQLNKLQERKKELTENLTILEDELKQIKIEYNQLRLLNREKKEAITALKEHESMCPLAPDYVNCPLSDKDIKQVVEELENEVKIAREAELKEDLQAKGNEIEKLKADINNISIQIENDKEKLEVSKDKDREIKRLERKLEEAKDELDKLAELKEPKGIRESLSSLDERLERGRGLIKTIDDVAEREEILQGYNTEIQDLEERVAALELLVKAFSPDGIENDLIQPLLTELNDQANQVLDELTTGNYQMNFQTEGDEFLIVKKSDWLDLAPVKVLSTSEKLRLGVIIQHVLNQMTNLKFLLIDEADSLEPVNRELLIKTILQLRNEYDQIMILSTIQDREPSNPDIPGLKVWWLDDGTCRQI